MKGVFQQMANGSDENRDKHRGALPFTVSKRRGTATVFALRQNRRNYPLAATGIPLADPAISGALWIDTTDRSLKVSEG